jgi:hypothetical protein
MLGNQLVQLFRERPVPSSVLNPHRGQRRSSRLVALINAKRSPSGTSYPLFGWRRIAVRLPPHRHHEPAGADQHPRLLRLESPASRPPCGTIGGWFLVVVLASDGPQLGLFFSGIAARPVARRRIGLSWSAERSLPTKAKGRRLLCGPPQIRSKRCFRTEIACPNAADSTEYDNLSPRSIRTSTVKAAAGS